MKQHVTAIILLVTLGLSAQNFDMGLKGGVNFVEVDLGRFSPAKAIDKLKSDEPGVGYHAGIYTRFNMGIFFIQPEAVYSQLHQRLSAVSKDGEEPLNIRFSRVDIPVLAGLNLGPFRLGAGLVGSFPLKEGQSGFNQSLNKVAVGYQYGIGLDVSNLSLDVRYESSLTKMADQIEINNTAYQFKTRTDQIIISLGVRLF
ncbi:MAG: porin family protein [Owenweeksia sp.]|nr:porin family protein [Owenweeksia sp.]